MAGISGNTGKEGDPVVRSRRQIAPIAAADFGHGFHPVGTSTHGCGIGDLIAHIQILDASDYIFGAAIMPADCHITVPDAGIAEMSQSFFHAGGCFAFPQIVVLDPDCRNGDFSDGTIGKQEILCQLRESGVAGVAVEPPCRKPGISTVPPPEEIP